MKPATPTNPMGRSTSAADEKQTRQHPPPRQLHATQPLLHLSRRHSRPRLSKIGRPEGQPWLLRPSCPISSAASRERGGCMSKVLTKTSRINNHRPCREWILCLANVRLERGHQTSLPPFLL